VRESIRPPMSTVQEELPRASLNAGGRLGPSALAL
jgi:hypothetical protein